MDKLKLKLGAVQLSVGTPVILRSVAFRSAKAHAFPELSGGTSEHARTSAHHLRFRRGAFLFDAFAHHLMLHKSNNSMRTQVDLRCGQFSERSVSTFLNTVQL